MRLGGSEHASSEGWEQEHGAIRATASRWLGESERAPTRSGEPVGQRAREQQGGEPGNRGHALGWDQEPERSGYQQYASWWLEAAQRAAELM